MRDPFGRIRIGLKSNNEREAKKAYEGLMEILGKVVYRVALKFLKSHEEAQDAVQEVLGNYWPKRNDFDKLHNPYGYFSTATKNYCLKRLAEKAIDRDEASAYTYYCIKYTKPYLPVDEPKILERIKAELTDDQRLLMEMKFEDELSNAAIGEMLGVPANTISQRCTRLKAEIRKILSKYIPDA